MPFLRYDRDRRGNLTTYLVHTFRKGGKPHSLVLYWFRSPANVRVGRLAIDDDTIRTIEALYPDLAFDWPKLLSQRPPPLEMKRWTSKRKQGKDLKGGSVRRRRSREDNHVEEALSSEGSSLGSKVELIDSLDAGTEPGQSPEGVLESTEIPPPNGPLEAQVVAVGDDQVDENVSSSSQSESELEKPIDQVDGPPMTGTDPDE